MKLEDLPRIVPGATVRVRLIRGLFFVSIKTNGCSVPLNRDVTIKHEGREGHGTHKQLTFATRRAVLSLAPPP